MLLKLNRAIFAPLGIIGILCIWLYVLFTLGWDHANHTVSKILDL